MSKEQKGFIVYGDSQEIVNKLSDEDAGKLFKGMFEYFATGCVPKFDGVLEMAFIPMRQVIDRNTEKYNDRCEKNRANANKRWESVRTDTIGCERIQSDANDANINTKTNINTTTNTNTNTKDRGSGEYGSDEKYDLWKNLDSDDIDAIYKEYPDSGGLLIQEVADDVKRKRKTIKKPRSYILGYAKRVGWDDAADHFIPPWEA